MDTDYDHEIGFRIKGKAKLKNKHDAPQPQDTCVICLESVTERAIAVPCNHLNFDFLCLCSWVQENPSCPLCKTTLTHIEYDHRSPDDCKVYRVPEPDTKPVVATSSSTSTRPNLPPRPRRRAPPPKTPTPDAALSFRRQIYANQNYSLHVGANRHSQYANFTPATFNTSHALQSRARIFMRRELQVFSHLSARHMTAEFLIEYIVAVLKKMEIKDATGEAIKLVAEFLGNRDAPLFLHELEAWLRSPYERLQDWDRKVQYAHKRSSTDGRG